jgi:hypothetical protein
MSRICLVIGRVSIVCPSATIGALVRPVVSMGSRVVNAADATPGMAPIACSISCCRRVTRSASEISVGGIEMLNVRTRSACMNPGSTLRSA